MEELINKEFDDFQKQLDIRDKKLKTIIKFETSKEMEDMVDSLKEKEIIL